jgi:hypothetical protein
MRAGRMDTEGEVWILCDDEDLSILFSNFFTSSFEGR